MGKVTFLGVEGSGKTVLSVALVDAFQELEPYGLFLRPDSRESYRFLMQQVPRLRKGELPGQTAAMKQLVWTVVHKEEVIRKVDVLDYPGELYRLAFLEAKDDTDPEGFKEKVAAHRGEIDEFLGHLVDSDQVFVLFNLDDAMNQEDNAKNLDAVWVTNACLGYLQKLPTPPKVTFLLTQVDRFSEDLSAFDAKEALSKHLPLIARNFPELSVVPIAARVADGSKNGVGETIRAILPEDFSDKYLLRPYQEALAKLEEGFRHISASYGSMLEDLSKSVDAIQAARDRLPGFLIEGFQLEYGHDLTGDARTIIRVLGECLKSDGDGLECLLPNSPEQFRTDLAKEWLLKKRGFLLSERHRVQVQVELRKAREAAEAKHREEKAKRERFYAKAYPIFFLLSGVLLLIFLGRIVLVWVRL